MYATYGTHVVDEYYNNVYDDDTNGPDAGAGVDTDDDTW